MTDKLIAFIKHYKIEIMLYFILIPMLYPEGFVWYNALYKLFFTLWVYAAALMCMIVILEHFRKKAVIYKPCVNYLLLYEIIFILITLIVQKGIQDGKQKLFIVPILCLFCAVILEKEKEQFIDVLSNIIIGEMVLNITVFHPFFWPDYFNVDEHILFIGHVQVFAQIGVLGLLLSYILYRKNKSRKKSVILLLLSVVSMIMSDTIASYIIIFVCGIGGILAQCNFGKKILTLSAEVYIGLFLLANLIIIFLVVGLNGDYSPIFGIDVSFHGRMYIWHEAVEQIKSHWILGYGCYGFLLQVFWSASLGDGLGMNYAHSEALQRLLEGGIVLFSLFILVLVVYGRNLRKIKDVETKIVANICMGAFFLIMLIESVTEYYYFFLFLSVLAYMPEMESLYRQKSGIKQMDNEGKKMNIISYLREKGIKRAFQVLYQYKLNVFLNKFFTKLYAKKPLKDIIIIESHNDFDCNGGPLYDYLLQNGYNKRYKIVWLLKNKFQKRELPPNVTWVYLNKTGLRKSYYIARAKYLFFDNHIINTYRKDQTAVFFDHGAIGMKSVRGMYNIPDCITYIAAPSHNYAPVLAREYSVEYPSERFVVTGYPQNDILYKPSDNELKKITDKTYNKVYLWMPTFRKGGGYQRNDSDGEYPYGIPLIEKKEMLESLQAFLETTNSLMILKIHPMQDLSTIEKLHGSDNICVLTGPEVKERDIDNYRLIKNVDALISDYSAIPFSFLLLDRPMAFVLSDRDQYKLDYPVDNPDDFMVGDKIYTFEEFLAFLKDVQEGKDSYSEKRKQLSEWLYEHHDGNSCERILQIVGVK